MSGMPGFPPLADADVTALRKLVSQGRAVILCEGNFDGVCAEPEQVLRDPFGADVVDWRIGSAQTEQSRHRLARALGDEWGGALAAAATGAAALLAPVAALLVGSGEAGVILLRRWLSRDTHRDSGDLLGEALPAALHALADREKRTFVLLQATQPGAVLVLRTLGAIRLQPGGENVTVLVGLTSQDSASDDAARSVLDEVAQLEARHLASRWPVTRLDHERLDGWLGPIDPDMADLLLSLSGRSDVAAAALWREWRAADFVERLGDCWRQRPGRLEPIHALVTDVLARLPTGEQEVAYDALGLGALQGQTFSGLAAVSAAAALNGLPPDRAIPRLLDIFVSADFGVLQLAHVEGQGLAPEAVSSGVTTTYGFRHPVAVTYLRSALGEDQTAYTRVLVEHLQKHHRTDALFDADIARLAASVGESSIARSFAMRAKAQHELADAMAWWTAVLTLARTEPPTAALAGLLTSAAIDACHLGWHDTATQLSDASLGMWRQVDASSALLEETFHWAGVANREVGNGSKSFALLQMAYAVALREHVKAPSSAEWIDRFAMTSRSLGDALCKSGRLAGLRLLEDSVSHERSLTAGSARLESEASGESARAIRQERLAGALHDLATTLSEVREHQRAIELIKEAESLRERVLRADPRPNAHRRHDVTVHACGYIHWHAGQLSQAMEYLMRAAQNRERMLLGPDMSPGDRFDYARTLQMIGLVHQGLGEMNEAIQPLEAAIAQKRLVVQHERIPHTARSLALSLETLAVSLAAVGRSTDHDVALDEATHLREAANHA
jgi:tetratricopeptide (TPR) repeat protein